MDKTNESNFLGNHFINRFEPAAQNGMFMPKSDF